MLKSERSEILAMVWASLATAAYKFGMPTVFYVFGAMMAFFDAIGSVLDRANERIQSKIVEDAMVKMVGNATDKTSGK